MASSVENDENPFRGHIECFGRTLELLEQSGNVSDALRLRTEFSKSLCVGAASYFEERLTTILRERLQCVCEKEGPHLAEFFTKKALDRQYHTLFDWASNNINVFLKKFGNEFFKSVSARIDKDEALGQGVTAFMRLNKQRNLLVHENFLLTNTDLSSTEVIELFDKAMNLLAFLETALEAHRNQVSED